MSLVLQVFGQKPKYWTKWNFDPMVPRDEKSADHQSYYSLSSGGPEGVQRISCQSISVKCQPHGGATGKVRGSPKSVGFIIWES